MKVVMSRHFLQNSRKKFKKAKPCRSVDTSVSKLINQKTIKAKQTAS